MALLVGAEELFSLHHQLVTSFLRSPTHLLSLRHRMFKSSDNQPHEREAQREKGPAPGPLVRLCLQGILPAC